MHVRQIFHWYAFDLNHKFFNLNITFCYILGVKSNTKAPKYVWCTYKMLLVFVSSPISYGKEDFKMSEFEFQLAHYQSCLLVIHNDSSIQTECHCVIFEGNVQEKIVPKIHK